MYELINIFDTFLPQLLLYPNPSDPLNPEAARLLNEKPEEYKIIVKNHVEKFAAIKLVLTEESKVNNIGINNNNGHCIKHTKDKSLQSNNSKLSEISFNENELDEI